MTPRTPLQWALTLIIIAFALYGLASAADALLMLAGRT